MMKGLFVGGLMALWLAAAPAWAQSAVDSVTWLEGDYIGVGGIDMHKLAQRRIYSYLMNFFVTDRAVRQTFQEIRASGVVMEDILQRIVVGVPVGVEHSEHIVIWETSEDLTKYRSELVSRSQLLNVRNHLGVEYYATKRENECLVILDSVVVLGSELRVKEIIASRQAGYKKGPKNEGLKAELKRVDQSKDAWFVFSLSAKERDVLKRTDPLIDMSAGGLGVLNMSELQRGNIVFDFSAGLNAQASLNMVSDESAARSSGILDAARKEAAESSEVKELGFDSFLAGVGFKSQKNDVKLSIIYDQTTFDDLIARVTLFAKSVSASSKKAPAPQEPALEQPAAK